MSVNPNLQCPASSNSIPSLQFIDPKMLGVVAGSNTCSTVNLNNFFVPISQWAFNVSTIQPGRTQRIDISNIQSLGDRKEYHTFDLAAFYNASPVADAPVTLNVVSGNTWVLTFQSGTTVTDFVNNLNAAIRNNEDLIDILYCEFVEDYTVQIYSKTIGVSYQYNLYFYEGTPNLEIIGVLTQSHIRYPNGRVKVVFLMIDYDETLPSNQKHVEYAYDDDYQLNAELSLFRKFGKMFFIATDDDVEETDMNLSETVWVKNPQTFPIKIKIFIAS